MSELWHLDATEQARLVRSGEVAPDDPVVVAVARAEAVDGTVNSIVHPRFDARFDRGRTRGEPVPLAGVPFAVKDWKCTTAGEPSTWSMRALGDIDHRAIVTTELAERYARAGLVTIGRTNLPELAFGPPTTEPDAHGPSRNPWNPTLSVGGSSGGSAAAVAAGIVPIANASDGGGSLRIPAACCGLVGLKVSRGRITNAPHADGRGAKVEGHVARTVRDVALLLDLTQGPVPGDPFALAPIDCTTAIGESPRALRIGILDRAPLSMDRRGDGDCGIANREAVAVAARWLADLGHRLEPGHPGGLDEPLSTPQLYAAERAALRRGVEQALGRPLTRNDVEPRTWAMFELAAASSGPDVIAELDREQQWTRGVHRWWADGWDLLLTPALGRTVPAIGELKETADDPLGTVGAGFPLAWFTYPFNVSGNPAVVVPVARVAGGPPIAVQLVAALGREDLLLQVAAQLESAIGWTEWWRSMVDDVAGA
jgi:amidase